MPTEIQVKISNFEYDGQISLSDDEFYPYMQISYSIHKLYEMFGMKSNRVLLKGSSVAHLFVPNIIIPNDYDITVKNLDVIIEKTENEKTFKIDEARTIVFESTEEPSSDYEMKVVKCKLLVSEGEKKSVYLIDLANHDLFDTDFLFNGLKMEFNFPEKEVINGTLIDIKCVIVIRCATIYLSELAKVKLGLPTTFYLLDQNQFKPYKKTITIASHKANRFGIYLKRLKKVIKRGIKVRGVVKDRKSCSCGGELAGYYFYDTEFWEKNKDDKCVECQLKYVADEKYRYIDIDVGFSHSVDKKCLFDIFPQMKPQMKKI